MAVEKGNYTPLEVQRLDQLDRVSSVLRTTLENIQERAMVGIEYRAENGLKAFINPDKQFAYGVWRIRRTLIADTREMGLKAEAMDIVARHAGGEDGT